MIRFLTALLLLFTASSCAVVREYEMVNLNDPDMILSEKPCDRNIAMFQSYREAAAGANGGKTGGGCGCN
jgi:hypothetical protein